VKPPVALAAALASFEATWSPRIVAQVNDYDVRVAHVRGEHVWHVHEGTDEFFLVLDGTFTVAIRDEHGAESAVELPKGSAYVVPRGVAHRPSSPDGAQILMFEPTGTGTVGDRHEGEIGEHIDATTGHALWA